MSNAKGSKSARTTKPPTPAHGGKPEAKIENGTTVVLPNPTDAQAPPPKRGPRKKKAAPTNAAKAATGAPASEVPDWAKRAAARDTVAEMAAVPEVAPTAAPAPEAATAKKGRTSKARATPKETVTAVPGCLRAIGEGWIASLRAAGHTTSTVSSYTNDLEVAYEFLGADSVASAIAEKQIAAFNTSKGVMKKANGKAKAQPTILKTRRALRLALVWAEQQRLIKKAPYAAKTPA